MNSRSVHEALAAAIAPADVADSSRSVGSDEACFHCGQPCLNREFVKGSKLFCCNGCVLVHDLLTDSGLGHFYDLNPAPGTRASAVTPSHWQFLDDTVMQQQLLDFSDGNLSRVTFRVPAIHCIACVWLLENLFRLQPAIGRSEVNFPRREVAISFATQQLKLSELVTLLCSIGYEPSFTFDTTKPPAQSGRKQQWLRIGVAGFAFGNVMLFSLPQYFGLDAFSGSAYKALFGWISLALALPVVTFSAADYWKSARLAVRRRRLTLDVPIALGIAAIYFQSAFEILSRAGEGYCDSLTGLIFLLLCGRAFQEKTQERLAFDRDYRSFFPLSAIRLSNDIPGEPGPREQRISLAELQVGDRLLVRNSEIIPADARLVSGPALIDYSFVTGESDPVSKNPGDYLYAGGRQSGPAIEVETTKAVSQSYLASLWNHEAFRKHRDHNIDSLTNRYSRRFTRAVIVIAVGAAIFWAIAGDAGRGLKAFTSVLIVACPCALALAAPFALGTAQRWLARNGVFLRNALVLERLARINSILFDKTGTLTSSVGDGDAQFIGKPLAPRERDAVWSLARQSIHPHSTRIAHSLAGNPSNSAVLNFRETPGCGVEGRVADQFIRLGSQRWLESNDIPCDGSDLPGSTGASCIHLAIDGEWRGRFLVAPQLRPDAREAIRHLGRDYELALLSGDSDRDCDRFYDLFGADACVHFNQSPIDKLNFVRRLQESDKTVMMVGDGLNDAGALRQSDVGVAVVEDVGAFSPSSDVILRADRVPQLPQILELAQRTVRIVRFSFAISAAYNLAGVGIAAAGLLSPVICAVLMPLSSVTVVAFACGAVSWAARGEFGGRRAEVGDQRSEVRGRRADVGSRRSDVRGPLPSDLRSLTSDRRPLTSETHP